MIVKIIY